MRMPFMERYDPTAEDLASQGVVAQSMHIEIREGYGVDLEKTTPTYN
jgi:succinate dehydrogenase/fumarate reductase flavoprotein subunit